MIKSIWKVAALVAVFAGAANAADMPVKAVRAPIPVYTWTGFYAGINGGYAWRGDRTITFAPGDPAFQGAVCPFGCPFDASNKLKGAFGGLQAGYNWQVNPNFVAGIEADIQAAGIRGTGTTPVFLAVGLSQIQADQKVKWFGTIRGRLGVLPTERILAYVTGGLAAGRVEESASYFAGNRGGVTVNGVGFDCIVAYPECFSGTSARTAVGWTAGAGLEIAAWQNITIKAEYLYVNLGGGANLTATALAAPPGIARSTFIASYGRADFNLFRVGLNYRFDPPVVARY
jgi:outer membrane immunogenic protein